MSQEFTFGQFPEVNQENYNEEVRELYKTRDDHSVETYNIDNIILNNRAKSFDNSLVLSILFKPNDPIYNKMSNSERIEKGLPSSLDNFFRSPSGLITLSFMFYISAVQFNKIYSPAGIIIRNSIKTSRYAYLS
jgi:hypothetical protein